MADGPELVRHEVDDVGVMTVTLDDPENRNGWSPNMENAYFAVLDAAAVDPAVRVVVLTGAGRSFCPGLAMSRLTSNAGQGLRIADRRPQYTPRLFPKPLIAAINGACAGIGLVQALQCDVRFAVRGAKFTTAFSRRGLSAEYNLAWVLPRLIGTENALDLLLSARTFLAEEAHALGLVSRLSEPDQTLTDALAYARDLAVNCAPTAMSVIRQQVYADLDVDFNEGLRRSFAAMAFMNSQPDMVEGVASFKERRPPNFRPLPADFDPAAVLDITPEPFPRPPA
ncbi:Enoyl-CoA hydratase [Frankia canadensis]|uniref:Enoyl-CoA hydratase n=1 Tax=Frankia canadensis TaxID=1836972 RepID=A0A2I2KNF4_9ACTN|nr:enoyl-CoA hydratase-related protein [Frankia canadensis]SNQ47179.1 Enoyl-CoA hydratase [Frankia canadensis]SOU54469.1 Enoyl-CoA hydratase [Frankia canadensis]